MSDVTSRTSRTSPQGIISCSVCADQELSAHAGGLGEEEGRTTHPQTTGDEDAQTTGTASHHGDDIYYRYIFSSR